VSLRWKIVISTVLTVLITLIVSAVLVREMVTVSESNRIREEATASLHQAAKILDETGISILNSTVNDPKLPAAAQQAAQQGSVVTYQGELDGEAVMFAAMPIELGSQPAVLSLSIPSSNGALVRETVDTALLWAGIATLIVVSVVGALIASRMVKRLWLGSIAARSIAAGRRDIVVEEAIGKPFAGKDEVDQFAAAVDAMAGELKAKIAAEQRFSADLAHELRTPLTGLVTAASILPESRPTELVQDRVAKLRVLVEDLLEVSRLESGTEEAQLEELSLDDCVAQILSRLGSKDEHGVDDLQVTLDAGESTVWVDLRRFERILSNLINNARTHGQGRIFITTRPGSVEVKDQGPGYPQRILAAGPERFVSKGGGIGLGLTIATGQAAAMGAALHLSNDSGARATLDFRS